MVFSSLSELTFNVYDATSRTQNRLEESAQQKRFEETGIFTPETVQYVKLEESNKFLSIFELVHLLVHLNIAAEILPANDRDYYSGPNDTSTGSALDLSTRQEYFLPAILKSADISSLYFNPTCSPGEVLPEPLCIRFQTGFLPMGFSCALVARLLAEEKLKLPPEEQTFYKNKMKFRYDGQFNITMISLPMRCEFHLTRHSGQKQFHDEQCCPEIMKIICKVADVVVKSMQRSLLSKNNYDFAFKCQMHQNVKFGNEPLAKCVYTDETRTKLKQIECLDCGTTTTDLSKEIKIWFGEVRN